MNLINSNDQDVAYKLSEGKLEALTELMIRSDVPILVSPKKGAILLHGQTREQAIFKDFVDTTSILVCRATMPRWRDFVLRWWVCGTRRFAVAVNERL